MRLVVGRESRVCPEIYRVPQLPPAVNTASSDIRDSFVVDVSAAFTCQMRDDAFELLRLVVNEIFSACVEGIVEVLLIGFGLEAGRR